MHGTSQDWTFSTKWNTATYFSHFPVLRRLHSLHSQSVISVLKQIFTQLGIPKTIVSDGGTQFTAQEFKDFTRKWQIEHWVTSPTNAQSNGQAERFVQTVKNSLTKVLEVRKDPNLALLGYITISHHQQNYSIHENSETYYQFTSNKDQ